MKLDSIWDSKRGSDAAGEGSYDNQNNLKYQQSIQSSKYVQSLQGVKKLRFDRFQSKSTIRRPPEQGIEGYMLANKNVNDLTEQRKDPKLIFEIVRKLLYSIGED